MPDPTVTVSVTNDDALGVWVVGEGTPVVLVHGALIWTFLKPLAEELAETFGYRAIWFHRRGYNGTPTEPPVDWADQARDIVKVLDALDIEKAHVVGHSAAAAYTLELATLAQDRLLSAAMLDVVLPDTDHVPSAAPFLEAIESLMERAEAGDVVGAARDFFAGVGGTEELLERYLPGSWAAMAEDAATMFQVEFPASSRWKADLPSIEAIRIPFAFMVVSKRRPFVETGECLQQWVPHATQLEISTDHHLFPITATKETAAVLDTWIKSQGTTV